MTTPVNITAYRTDGSVEHYVREMDDQPKLEEIRHVVDVLLEGQRLEHVTVLHEGKRTDMFVGEESANGDWPRNEAATAIYRNNWMTHHPHEDPETIAAVYGPAVLFSRRVWF